MTGIFFDAPGWLWGVPLLGGAAWFLIRRNRRIGWIQVGMMALFLLAAAQPMIHFESLEKRHLLLVEEQADVADLPEEYRQWERRSYQGSPAFALSLAAAELPDQGGVIAIFGDLIEADHSLEARLEAIRARGIAVEALPESARVGHGEPVVRDLAWPPRGGVGATVPVRLQVESADTRTVVIRGVDPAGNELFSRSVELRRGTQEVICELHLATPGTLLAQVQLEERDCGLVAIEVDEPFVAGVLAREAEKEAAHLQALFGSALILRPGRSAADFHGAALLVLGEGVATELTAEQRQFVVGHVRSGGGVLAIAGRNAILDTAAVEPEFAALFPVTYAGELENKLPTVALVIIIDTSGSMRGGRMDLARETARLALENLRENDLAGIVEFHGTRRWAAPLQSAENQFSLMRALNRLNAGGGTVILPALEEAFYALRNADTRLKHVLILTDGGVEYGDFESLIRKMTREDITVSTVMVGPGESFFLSQLASWGHGRFFRASSRFALPDLQWRPQGINPLPPFAEGEFPVTIARSPVVAELPENLTVTELVKSTMNEGGRALLTAGGDPLLAVKRSGLGATAVWNSSLTSEGLGSLGECDAFLPMLAALARSLPDALAFDGIRAWNRSCNLDLDFEFETAEPHPALQLTLAEADGAELGSWRVAPAANGGYRFRMPDLPPGVYRIHVAEYDRAYPFVARPAPSVSPVSAEVRAAKINRGAMLERAEPSAAEVAVAPWLALAGAMLLIWQLALRRIGGILALTVLAGALPLFAAGGEYENRMRAAIGLGELDEFARAAEGFTQAAASAENDEDRDFAWLLAWESARVAGTLPEYVRQALADPGIAGMRANRLLAELEESGRVHEAWTLAMRLYRAQALEAAEIFLLAERSGHIEWVRQALEQVGDDPALSWLALQMEIRGALLEQRRSQAEALYHTAIAGTADAERLEKIARTAEGQALYEVAEAALQKILAGTQVSEWPTFFQLVQLYRKIGREKEAVALLEALGQDAGVESAVLLTAGDLCAQLGQMQSALKLYRASDSEEAWMRIAALETERGEQEKALEAWETMIFASTTEMRAVQAIEQLTEALRKWGVLDAYCVGLAQKMATVPSERLLQLYARALAAAGKHDELFALLSERDEQALLLRYLLEFRRYPQAVELLRREAAQHPERAVEWEQKLAMIAIESQNHPLAVESLERLQRLNSSSDASGREFAGAVYSLLGDAANAVKCYEEALQIAPQKAELLLLWGREKQALSQKQEALEFFARALPEESSPERFGVLVDGLLNLNAPKAMLTMAQQEILRRIQCEPENLFYYQLAEDFAEELQDFEQMRHLERLQLAVAPERRSLLLQKLFLDACRRETTREALWLGRVLMALPERYAPEVYRALAAVFVREGLLEVAERCMRDADRAEGGQENLLTLIDIFQQHQSFDAAARICREGLLLAPDRVELLVKYAAILEFQGRYREAALVSLKAMTLTIASWHVADDQSRRGTAQGEIRQTFRLLTAGFVNQGLGFPDEFRGRLAELTRGASNPAQAGAWRDVVSRLELLLGEKRPELSPAAAPDSRLERAANVVPVAWELAAQVRSLPPEEGAGRIAQVFAALPESRRERYWGQLLDVLDFEPAAAVAEQLSQVLQTLEFKSSVAGVWQLPYGVALKCAYAERLLAAQPEEPEAMALAARMRHLAGNASAARMLAEVIYEQLEVRQEYSIPDVRLLVSLNVLFADAVGEDAGAGRRTLLAWIAEREAAVGLSGATAGRLLVLGILLFGVEEYDRAFEVLCEAWKLNRNDFALFWALRDGAERSGRWTQWAECLLEQPPADPATLALYWMQLLPVLRELGFWRRAEELLPELNPIQQRRERLLLAMARQDHAKLLAAFMEVVRLAREGRGAFSGGRTAAWPGGIHDWRAERKRFHDDAFVSAASRLPECRAYLTYLLAGCVPGEAAFDALWRALRALPSTEKLEVAPELSGTLGALFLRVDSACEALSGEEMELLATWAERGGLPVELTVAILDRVAPERAAQIAETLLRQEIAEGEYHFDAAEVTPLLARLTVDKRQEICARIGDVPGGGVRDDVELQRLSVLKAFAPEVFLARLQTACYPATSTARWLTGRAEVLPQDCRDFLLSSEELPDWEALLPLCATPQAQEQLVNAFHHALERLSGQNRIDRAQVVRHYALLAVADVPERRPGWLRLAQAKHSAPGAPTLWLIDALRANGEEAAAEALQQELADRKKCGFPQRKIENGFMNLENKKKQKGDER